MDKRLLAALLFVVVSVEVFCNAVAIVDGTFGVRFKIDHDVVSIVYFVSGLCVALLPLVPARGERTHRGLHVAWFFVAFVGFAVWIVTAASSMFESEKMNVRFADMLFVVRTMCERLLTGENVYAIPHIWDGMQPVYLPAMWLPFVPAVALGVDLRWTSAVVLLAAVALTALPSLRRRAPVALLLPLLPLAIFLWRLFECNTVPLAHTEEIIVVFWYALLVWSLRSNNAWWIGVAIAGCMLSRYALAFWCFAYFVALWLHADRKRFAQSFGIAAAFGVLLMLATGALKHLDVFLPLQSQYLSSVTRQRWKFEPIVNDGLGLTRFVPYESLPLLHRVIMIASVVVPLTWLLLYRRLRNRVDQTLFWACGLKLSLVFFYNLLIAPYLY